MVLPVTNHGNSPRGRMIRPRHERLTIPLGAGLDRDSGKFFTERGTTRDLRNALLRGGSIHLRDGMADITPSRFVTAGAITMSDILGLKYLPHTDVLVVVAANRDVGEVHVFTMAGLGAAIAHVGLWTDAISMAAGLPVIVVAESYQKVFMAHDEIEPASRAPTFVYDPEGQLAVGGNLGPLTTTLTPLLDPSDPGYDAGWAAGDGYIRFRGVVSYLNYLVGWGFGTNLDNRPEFVRISLPGLPIRGPGSTVAPPGTAGFEEAGWAMAGSRGAPVISCAPAGNGLVILKETEAFPLVGTSPQTFGVGPALDQKFGISGPNLWTNLNGVLYVWTHEGPRATTGGALEDMAIPLDLDGPTPDELAEVRYSGFGTYVPGDRVVLFVFGRWIYALDVRGGPSGWSYWESAVSLSASEVVIDRGDVTPPGPGPYFSDLLEATTTTLRLEVNNVANLGTELIEVWRRTGSNPYTQASASTERAVIGDLQDILLSGLVAGTIYDIAFRYVKSGLYHEDYTGPPETWPEASRTRQMTAARAPSSFAGVWSRLSAGEERIRLTWVNNQSGWPVEIYHGTELLASLPAGTTQYDHTNLHATIPLVGEEHNAYRVVQTNGEFETPAAEVSVWSGPLPPSGMSIENAVACSYEVVWTTVNTLVYTEIRDFYPTGNYAGEAAPDTDYHLVTHPGNNITCSSGVLIEVAVETRHRLESFGIDDFSPWVRKNVWLCDDCVASP